MFLFRNSDVFCHGAPSEPFGARGLTPNGKLATRTRDPRRNLGSERPFSNDPCSLTRTRASAATDLLQTVVPKPKHETTP